VKWGFCGWPDPAHEAHADRLRWLWDASSAFFPCCYVVYKATPGGEHLKGTAPPEEYVEGSRKQLRVARGTAGPDKPVICLIWMRYHELNRVYGGRFLDARDLEQMVRTPLEEGADGVAFWDVVDTAELASKYNEYVREGAGSGLRRFSRMNTGTTR
jgi:hypothetical protein